MYNEACMVEGKSYTVGENFYLCEQQIQVFSPLSTDNTLTNRFQLDSSTAMYSRGKIFKGGELETTEQVISLLKLDGLLLLNILHNNQLKELGHTSNNAMVTLPVHVFLG